jgi:hypothetical protein
VLKKQPERRAGLGRHGDGDRDGNLHAARNLVTRGPHASPNPPAAAPFTEPGALTGPRPPSWRYQFRLSANRQRKDRCAKLT